MYISRFQRLDPSHIVAQDDGLRWLAAAHARESGEVDADTFFKMIRRFGCGSAQISHRGTFLRDFTHQDWNAMQIFGAEPGEAQASGIDRRQAFFREVLREPVSRLYPETEPDFAHWIHVTCTGYSSPSVVQELASVRGWGERVQVMHAYHMGCYAALPALRMARGNGECEIVHTELCTLHLDPRRHDPEQLVIQSLFADGMIRYRATDCETADARPINGFMIEEIREVIAPASLSHMTWDVSGYGFRMTLAREVPALVKAAVAGVVRDWRSVDAVYAIHPGGPRIIDGVKEALELSEEQVYFSREVLRKFGNMSSATLPHVWMSMLNELPEGTPVVSMAFGPGLTVAASLMRKVGRMGGGSSGQ
jgi:predicted naringenin-chalcone synthase